MKFLRKLFGRDAKPAPLPANWIAHMAKVKVEPGDVLVLQFDGAMSIEQHQRVRSYCQQVMGDTKVLILDRGLKLGVVQLPKVEG